MARTEPYRLSDLNTWLASIRPNPRVAITLIGKTAEGRPLEIVRIGHPEAPYRVFLRARAHAWEPGGNWVVPGALVTITDSETGLKRSAQTDDSGRFNFPQLKPRDLNGQSGSVGFRATEKRQCRFGPRSKANCGFHPGCGPIP